MQYSQAFQQFIITESLPDLAFRTSYTRKNIFNTRERIFQKKLPGKKKEIVKKSCNTTQQSTSGFWRSLIHTMLIFERLDFPL